MGKLSHILCVSAGFRDGEYAPKIGYNNFEKDILEEIRGNLWIGPRPFLETLKPVERKSGELSYPTHLQIIPYYVFEHNGKILAYSRSTSGNETRLHGKISIGIGGHIDLEDVAWNDEGQIDLVKTLTTSGKRESKEEFNVDICDENFSFVGTIYATDTEVDLVHVGVVGICSLSDAQVATLQGNDEISEYGFKTYQEIMSEITNDPHKTLETWTGLIVESSIKTNGEVA